MASYAGRSSGVDQVFFRVLPVRSSLEFIPVVFIERWIVARDDVWAWRCIHLDRNGWVLLPLVRGREAAAHAALRAREKPASLRSVFFCYPLAGWCYGCKWASLTHGPARQLPGVFYPCARCPFHLLTS